MLPARGGRLPRHDAHRRRAIPAIWPDILADEPRRGARRARRVRRRAARGAREIVASGARDDLLAAARTGARRPAATCPIGVSMADRPGRAAGSRARPARRARRGDDARRPARRERRSTSRSRTRSKAVAACSCCVVAAIDADAYEGGLQRPRLPRRADRPRVSLPERARRSEARVRCADGCGCRATSRSRTGRCSSPRSRPGAARSRTSRPATTCTRRGTRSARSGVTIRTGAAGGRP